MGANRSAGIIVVGLLVGATACGERKQEESGAVIDSTAAAAPVAMPETTMAPVPTPAEPGATLTVASSTEYGSYLADGQGRALYLFTADKPGESSCSGACAAAWPPYIAPQSAPAASAAAGSTGVQAAMIGTIQRADGKQQITYNQHPLYYFAKDQGPGQTMGQDLTEFGGEWYLLTPQGEKLEKKGEQGS